MKPERIQRRRSKGWRTPPSVRYVGRPTVYGNPFTDADKAIAVEKYRQWINEPEQAHIRRKMKKELRGLSVSCWCPLDGPCHADVVLEIANEGDK